MNLPNWFRMFPEEDFRWPMGLQPEDAVAFFAPTDPSGDILARRRALLRGHPEHYAVLPESAGGPIGETLAFFGEVTGRMWSDPIEAGGGLEPDWVILTRDGESRFCVTAGVVCFPSYWSLPSKAGSPMARVHDPVAGLNAALETRIDAFLDRLAPGLHWGRENWALTAEGTLDQHPRYPRRLLAGEAALEATWLRLERQLFARLPGGPIVFGIRVGNHRLDELCRAQPGLAPRIARALLSMPDEAAAYKELSACRRTLARQLAVFDG